jgi:hypothetical protein
MNAPTNAAGTAVNETDWADAGCSRRACRYEHSHVWGQCYYAEEPTPDDRCFRWKTVIASDGYSSIVTEEVDHAELRAEIEREVRAKVAEEVRREARRRSPRGRVHTYAEEEKFLDLANKIVRGES